MFTRDLQLGRDRTEDQLQGEGKAQIMKYEDGKAEWAAFCMYPDIIQPTRMPAHFPVHSHIVKRQTTFNIVPGTNGLMSMWIPNAVWRADTSAGADAPNDGPARVTFNGAGLWAAVDATSANVTLAANNDVTSGFGYLSNAAASYSVSLVDVTGAGDVSISIGPNATPTLQYNSTPAVTSSVAHGGQRIIGAFIEFEYIGTTLEHSGYIEVGLHYHAIDDEFSLRTAHFMSPAEIIQAPYYKRFKPIDGARCVWFPIDYNDFTFVKTYIDTGTLGPEALAGQRLGRPQNPIRLEWGINFQGFQPNQAMRCHMTTFFETIPDEKDRDLYNTSTYKGKLNIQQSQQIVAQVVNEGMVSTPSKNSWYNNIGKAINTMFDMTNAIAPKIANVIPGYGLANAANQYFRNS